MKYLRKFNENIYTDISFQKDIKDMTLELQDEGFDISFGILSSGGYPSDDAKFNPDSSCMSIIINTDLNKNIPDSYQYEEIEDVVERIKEYSVMNGYHCHFTWRIEADEHGVEVGTLFIYKDNFKIPHYYQVTDFDKSHYKGIGEISKHNFSV